MAQVLLALAQLELRTPSCLPLQVVHSGGTLWARHNARLTWQGNALHSSVLLAGEPVEDRGMFAASQSANRDRSRRDGF
jgi:hypothetical protein